jgi:pimeloyl-ACP methyl ester carboxylesterase
MSFWWPRGLTGMATSTTDERGTTVTADRKTGDQNTGNRDTADRDAYAPGTGEYAEVNGLRLYYETYGSGRPLILLHGGLGSGGMFAPILPALSQRHQVIAVDLQGHGRTADIDRPLDPWFLADDIAALIDHLGLDRPDLVGYSLGGGVALRTAVRHPEKLGRLVATSAAIRRDAVYPEILAQQSQLGAAAAAFLRDTPMYEHYQRLAPRPEDFPRLLDKIGAALAQDFDLTDQIRGLAVPTLIVAADADLAPPIHFIEIFTLLDGGQRDGGWLGEGRPKGGHALAILPGLTHYTIFSSPLFATTVLAFLDESPNG